MLTPGKIWPGSLVRLTIAFEDDEHAPADPDTVLLKTISPAGVLTTYTYGTDDELERVSTGNYTCDVTPDRSGRWHFRWETTGTNRVIGDEGNFVVQYSPFTEETRTGY